MLNATWLETFTTLCEVGHFTRAADRLGMSQPGVSQHLRKLESQIGKPLIVQDGKTFTLTPAGEATFAMGQARRIQERGLRDVIATNDPDTGHISLACSGSFAMALYPALLDRLTQAPAQSITLEAAPQTTVQAGVLDGTFDLGIMDHAQDHPRLHGTELGSEEICLVLPALYEGNVDLDTLDALGFVGHPDGFAYADDLLALNFPDSFRGADRLRLRTRVNQISQITAPVARGLGYTILPRSGVLASPHRAGLRIVALPQRRFHPVWLIHRHRRTNIARIAAVAAIVAAVADGLRLE